MAQVHKSTVRVLVFMFWAGFGEIRFPLLGFWFAALGGPSLLVGGFRLDSVLIWAVLACPTRVAQEAVITCAGHENNMELGFQVSAALGSSVEACQVWLFRVLRLSN